MAADFDKGAKIRRWEANLERPDAALKQVGALMVAESQMAFREQRIGDKDWEQRGPINVFGLIADFHAGKRSPPARRFQRRPALRDTGRLAASIAFRLMHGDVVEVGSNLPYAAVHHHGGKVKSEPINSQVRTSLWKWLKGKGKTHRKALGWLLNKKFRDKRLDGEVPERPIVAITKQTMADVKEAVGVHIMEAK